MKKIIFALLAGSAVSLALAGPAVAASPLAVPVKSITENGKQYANAQISVIGFVQFDELQHAYLFADRAHASKSNPSDGIDVGIPSSVDFNTSLLSGAHCVEVRGVFLAYTDGMILTGNPRSKAGAIKAESIKELVKGCD